MKIDYRLDTAEIRHAITAYLEKHHGAKAYQVEGVTFAACGQMPNGDSKIVATVTLDTSCRDPVNPQD